MWKMLTTFVEYPQFVPIPPKVIPTPPVDKKKEYTILSCYKNGCVVK